MGRFETSLSNMFEAFGAVGGIATLGFVSVDLYGLQITILLLLIVLGFVNAYLIYAVKKDLVNRITNVRGDITSRLDDVEEQMDGSPEETRADGSGWEKVPQLTAEKVEITGLPSAAGAVLGGALGATAGPGGAALGALVGAAIAGGKEYHDLKEQHQDQLRRIVLEAVQIKTQYQVWDLEIENISDTFRGTDEYWQFRVRDPQGESHRVRINKETGAVRYKRPS